MVSGLLGRVAGQVSVDSLDEFVVMPNHVQGVIFIRQPAPTTVAFGLDVVRVFKSVTTVEYGKGVRGMGWQRFEKRLWQRNYYERVVRNESELGAIRE